MICCCRILQCTAAMVLAQGRQHLQEHKQFNRNEYGILEVTLHNQLLPHAALR
jgi:hypothetical protein